MDDIHSKINIMGLSILLPHINRLFLSRLLLISVLSFAGECMSILILWSNNTKDTGLCFANPMNRLFTQIPQCTCPISHNAPFIIEMCTFLFWMMHCGMWDKCIVGFVRLAYRLMHLSPDKMSWHFSQQISVMFYVSYSLYIHMKHIWVGSSVSHRKEIIGLGNG